MPSNIDDTQPPALNPTTAALRANMVAAKAEISALQLLQSRFLSLRITSQKTLLPALETIMPWDAVITGDATGIWTIGDPTKLIIPTGYNHARVSFQLEISPRASLLDVFLEPFIRKNTSIFSGMAWDEKLMHIDTTTSIRGVGAMVPVVAGDYLRLAIHSGSDVNETTVFGNYNNGWIEIELTNR